MKKIFAILFINLTISVSLFSQQCEAFFYAAINNVNPYEIQFFDASSYSDSTVSWTWTFDNGVTSNEQNPIYTFPHNGDFLVILEIQANNCSDFYSEIINIYNFNNCSPNFTYQEIDENTNTFLFQNHSQTYNNQSTSWFWDFGDGTSSNEFEPTHSYSSDSSYYVTLYLTNDSCSSTFSDIVHTGNFYFGDSCYAMFSYETVDLDDLHFKFYNNSWQGNDSITSYLWNFGDGVFSSVENPFHEFSQTGTYLVSLSIETQNCSSSFSTYIYTGDSAWYPQNCQALFWFDENPNNNKSKQFYDFSYAEGEPYSLFWDFGDNSVSNLQNPMHFYQEDGIYNVTLQISNSYCQSTFTTQIIISSDSSYCSSCYPLFYPEINQNTIVFHNISTGNQNWWQWNFGDGSFSSEQNPTHIFDEVGVHEVAFSTGNGLCSNTIIMEIYLARGYFQMAYLYPGIYSEIKEINDINLTLYPNPSSDFIYLNISEKQDYSVSIFNSSGQILDNIIIQQQDEDKKIDITSYISGIYFVKIETENSIKVLKFVK